MNPQTKKIAIMAIAVLSTTPLTMRAAEPQQTSAPATTTTGQSAGQTAVPLPPPEYIQAGEADAKRLLLYMDTDKNGKVSKAEFMAYMEAEFERLDINHDGELDVKELTHRKTGSAAGGHR